jgi:chromosome segregation ATPase
LSRQRANVSRQSLAGQARESGTGVHYDEIPVRPVSELNLTRLARQREQINAQASGQAKEIEQLKRRQTEIERQREAADETLRKQEAYERGRGEMIDRFNQSVIALEKQENRATRMAQLYMNTRQQFNALRREVEAIDLENCADNTLRDELGKAVAVIESSRLEYNKLLSVVEASEAELGAVPAAKMAAMESALTIDDEPERDFIGWMKIGVALTLPLGVLVILLGIVMWVLLKV